MCEIFNVFNGDNHIPMDSMLITKWVTWTDVCGLGTSEQGDCEAFLGLPCTIKNFDQ